MSEEKMSEESKRIIYEDRMMPVMAEGKYKLVFGQQISVFGPGGGEEAADYNQKEQEFEVKSDKRFRIPETAIHSVYPPEHAEGDFASHLAQITFMTDSLPWERPIIGIGIPWICLILIDENDGVSVSQGTLGTLFMEKGASDLYIPDIPDGDKDTEVCAVDISREQMEEWLPAKTSLTYLTHVRQVSVEDKATHLYRTEGRFSNLICPRVPGKSPDGSPVHTQVHVVSLEGYEGLYQTENGETDSGQANSGGQDASLQDNGRQDRRRPDDSHKKMRMLSLASWMFTSVSKPGADFYALAKELNIGALRMQIGPKTEAEEANINKAGGKEPDEKEAIIKEINIKQMLDIGYYPMNYETREECRTLAWYRGPLIPANHEFVQTGNAKSCVNDSDGVLTYLQQTDMFDASYAAAWQLGALLGIKNKPFMEALYAIRRKNYEEDAYKRSWDYAQQILSQAGTAEAEQTAAAETAQNIGNAENTGNTAENTAGSDNTADAAYNRLMLTGLRLLEKSI